MSKKKKLTIAQITRKLTIACNRAIKMGWKISQGVTIDITSNKCCLYGAIDVAAGVPFDGIGMTIYRALMDSFLVLMVSPSFSIIGQAIDLGRSLLRDM
jgi:hypothetical protein